MNGRKRIDEAYSQMPVLSAIKADFERRKPLKGIRVGACLHLTVQTAVLLETLAAGGAEVEACASNPLSTQDDIVEALNQEGMLVFGEHGENQVKYEEDLLSVAMSFPQIVIDDGGDLTGMIHKVIKKEEKFPFGGLEETTTGVSVIRKMEKEGKLKYPIIAVNDTRVKNLFDNHFGTGQSTIDGILRATNVLLAGKTMVIAGFGHCGSGLADRARGMGCNVIITEIDPVKALQAHMSGFMVMPMSEAAKVGDIFVTVTGNRDVIVDWHMEDMKPSVILANSGHFDVEIDVGAAKARNLNILGEGRLVNLACAEGHPSEVMDMSFSAQALCAEYLINNVLSVNNVSKLKLGVLEVPKEIDQRVAELKLEAFEITIDKLTDVQKEYLGL
ncbi:adenosylhomocysteinase [Candidatus Dojkabacteria bacterium]|jgi:adenosylhomocysteinase|nr:adenosylhomocysteinase [Candidatus Dojkabacteria bacterium]